MTIITGTRLKSAILAKVGTAAVANHCLQEVRQVAGIPAKYGSAISAWNNASHRHAGVRPPVGAVVPVFFNTTNPYEHVAWAVGDGRVVTINGSRWSIYSSIAAMCRVWHCTYIGYTEDLNGVRLYTPPPPPPKYTSCTALQGAINASKDNIWGPDSNKRLNAVRAASAWKHVVFPYGVAYTQGVIGTNKDGSWGDADRLAHDNAVKRIQKAVGVKVTGRYDLALDTAVKKYLSTAKKV